MLQTPSVQQGKAGFALVVVLVTLAILTLLFTISSDRTISRVKSDQIELAILTKHQQSKEALSLAAVWKNKPENKDQDAFSITSNLTEMSIKLLDVSQFLDVNTANMKLANLFIQFLGGDEEAQKNYLAWRRRGVRMQRLSELPTILGIELLPEIKLERYATTFSGRKGVHFDSVDIPLNAFFNRNLNASQKAVLDTQKSGNTLVVTWKRNDMDEFIYAGVISSNSSPEILAMYE